MELKFKNSSIEKYKSDRKDFFDKKGKSKPIITSFKMGAKYKGLCLREYLSGAKHFVVRFRLKGNRKKYLSGAMAIKIKDNAQKIVEQEQAKKRSELQQEDERQRKKDPRRYGHFNPRGREINLRTKWNEIFPREKDEYDLAEEDLENNYNGPKYY